MSLKDAVAARKQRSSDQKTVALADVSKEPVKRLNVNVPESVFKQFKGKAAMDGKEMTELVNQWIQDYLRESE